MGHTDADANANGKSDPLVSLSLRGETITYVILHHPTRDILWVRLPHSAPVDGILAHFSIKIAIT